ncbi:acetyl-CoA carboxylase carboxyl transferase subunit alpha [Salipaludibacillus agaradhaerens]|jgi:acetyl-CoA carboxylase carboxyl transferase subunit alpha|uniref:Acetyl-coenzyme A carboxylase carboxyl transferase subunit alpha n=1 Tax=Salipaludibacillus agaradhaerens TaxID=76935 RepID=A0A9Q4AZB9_SALAG|nr:acetyl-CoA carboxylase carboxyl transferase subunit alpha [Salipaludibacillus agaradhaerens]MCR6095542.1 acetyl-CoA carboxylase carboxyl transferase subunit alpha [Salipaludibacillus agaradhaerens]MCR6107570.1 acetyl-CoA carboxylase carboxyl transferase subunit alpha [Salipaludibacillus agaradhaerens]MCR6114898.1 acetyl-CoA carboxylase carboxyl transferase subunit alpha [Salipaludibacillus agaradhaerens]MCR6119599.1 acetyl-CoA carboxylase carboxyl transferase subunit alpha [Salipaludibacillu
MADQFPFEKPIIELRNKISELKTFTLEKDIDLSGEIEKLEGRLEQLEEDIYGNMGAWDRVQIARHNNRPGTRDYIDRLFTDFLELHGDRAYGDDEAIIAGIAKFEEEPVTVIGHQRGKDTKENLRRNFGMPHPEGYRKALRLMKQAEKFKRPIICFIDTKGAYPGKAAEERGQSEAIAKNLISMAGLKTPIICIVIGEGGSGGALALGVGDRLYMLENSTYSVISPEGAAALLWKDASQAKRAAETMKITAPELKELGLIDDVIPEIRGGAHRNVDTQTGYIRLTIKSALLELKKIDLSEIVNKRYEKFNKIGQYTDENVVNAEE